MSLRIVPTKATPSTTTTSYGAPSAPGIHDTLRSNLSLTTGTSSTPSPVTSSHPLEARLTRWRATQDALKMEGLRRMYGIAEPIRRGMELRITGMGEWRPLALGASACVHSDILNGRDAEVGWEDVFTGGEMMDLPDFHSEMEGRMRMNW
ncbi:proteasome maturation factor UMP1 [Tothia fuscella]|uniref:Proteasome maturation factor UMP1 n=1 Tax=Tothia fuscella TaxID=1048955 RepID=A0A9P4NSU6_9PEZI|nr:proteasome maturation factor UMP1 [Tothia fuscella]